MANRREEVEIDLFQLCRELLKKLPVLALAAVILGGAVFGYAFLTNEETVEYKAEASIYLVREIHEEENFAPLYMDTTAAKALVDTSIYALQSSGALEAVSADAGISYDVSALSSMISAAQINSLPAIKVTVTSPVSGEAALIAGSVVETLPESIAQTIGDDSVNVSEFSISQEQAVSSTKSSLKMALVGAVAGAFLAACVVIFKVIFSEPVIYRASALAELYPELPVLASLPASGSRKNNTLAKGKEEFKYAAAKLLNMDSKEGEGLAVACTAVNKAGLGALELALAVAEFGRKVLLVDGELYGRQISAKAGLDENPGLTECICKDTDYSSIICKYENIDIMPAGKPVENIAACLADKKMVQLVQNMKAEYDYIVVDLPALGVTADALPLVKHMDGAVLSMEENKCTVKETDNCVERLMRTGTKLLGFIVG